MDQQKNKLFVGNVAYATVIQTLVDLFSKYGQVVDSYKPDQKGYAFITMENEEQANAALEALNGQEIDGRAINVSIAEPRKPREGGFSGGGNRDRGGFGGGRRDFNRDRRDRY
jgi:RNA recognition motif-containing protein